MWEFMVESDWPEIIKSRSAKKITMFAFYIKINFRIYLN